MGGLGPATLFSIAPILGAILAVTLAPETRGKTLEVLSPEPDMRRCAASGH